MTDSRLPDRGRRLDFTGDDLRPATDLPRVADPTKLLDPRPRVVDPLLAVVIERAPDVVLTAGEVGEPVVVGVDAFRPLLIAALGGRETPTVVWSDGLAEVVVHLDRTRVSTRLGFVVVALALESAQATGDVTVVLAVGRPDDPDALLITAEEIPHGPVELTDGWGRAVVAAVVTALLTVAADLAAAVGHDKRGLPLLPAAIRADKERVLIVPRARLDIEEDAR